MSLESVLEEQVTITKSISCKPEMWVDEHGDALYRYALMRLRDSQRAEDAVQETFLAALKAQNSFGGQSSERTWLIGILKHKIIDHYRKTSREVNAVFEGEGGVANEETFRVTGQWVGHWKNETAPQEWGAGPDALLESKDFWEILQECLNHMPARMAQVFTLREMDEMSTEEICETLQITTSNFWVLIHRARLHLRRCLETKYFRKQ